VADHRYITNTPLRLMLRDQLARLNRVIAESDRPDRVAHAHRYAVRVSRYIDSQTDDALEILRGKFGQNGWSPAIEDICRHVERETLTEVAGDPGRAQAA
jgi:hypothetical protein